MRRGEWGKEGGGDGTVAEEGWRDGGCEGGGR